MHRVRFQLLAALAAVFISLFGSRASADVSTGVPVRMWVTATSSDLTNSPYYGYVHIFGTFVPTTVGGNGYAENWGYSGTPGETFTTNLGTVNIQPGVRYDVNITSWCLDAGNIFVAPPPGYSAIIDGMYRNASPVGSTVSVRIVPQFQGPPGAAGFASTIAGAQVNWRLSLGFLRNGNDAGSLQLSDPATGSSWSNLFTPSALSYASTSAEVYVYQPNSILRQIIANQVAVDIVTLSSTSYEIRCYNPKQIQSYVPCTFSGQPFVTYRVERGTPDAAHTNDSTAIVIKLTRETRNITDTYQTNAPITRRDVMTLQRSGTWPNFLWIKNDWTLDGQTPLVSTNVQSGGTTQNRTEAITVKTPGGPTVASLTRGYTSYASCGEVLTTETLGTTNPRTASFVYNTSTGSPGNLGYVSSVSLPGGGWESYSYYDAGDPTSLSGGKLRLRYRPYVSTPATATGSMSTAEQTYYDYGPDPFGTNNRLAGTTTYLNGTYTEVVTFSYDDTDNGANDGIVAVSRVEAGMTTKMRYYREDTSDEYKRGQPVSTQQPDGVLRTFDYEVGNWSGTSFTPGYTYTTGLSTNASRITTILGTADANGAMTLVSGRSQKDVTIRDVRALPIRSESYVWNGSSWQATTWTNLVYNFAGLLVSRVSNNGATYTATWDGEKKMSETDETGVTLTYTYDAAGRVATTTRAAAGSIPAVVTSFTYDALGNVIEQRVGAPGGEQLVSAKTFDDATRPASETPAGLGTTTYSYDVANRSQTTTNPDGGTVIETSALDGRLVSKTGTAIVAEFYTYGQDTTEFGRQWTQVNYGTATSARWKKSTHDMLNRPLIEQRPTFGGQSTYVEQNTYNNSGSNSSSVSHLTKTTKTGLAPTLYQYDSFGIVNRSGLDVDNNGLLSLTSNDRIGDNNVTFELYNGAWWQKTTTIAYRTAGQSTPTTVKTVRQRLTGFPAGRLEETQETDVYGNVTITTKDVDRASSKVTVTTSRTGQTWKQIQVSINGLVVQSTGPDGLTTTTAYDALNRTVSVTDSRNNSVRTTYYPGTQLAQSIIDATNTTVSTTTYDTLGRVISKTDAVGHKTYTSYDLQGHTIRQWGDGTYPVSYGYDAVFGDRVTMSTYRGGAGWDQPDWPGTGANSSNSPGTADTTAWTFDQASGLLASKTDAAGRVVTYVYDADGRLSTRTWARGVATTYTYDAATGDQTAIQYSDGTPNLAYTYSRAGESLQVTLGGTGGIVESFDRDASGKITVDHLDTTFFGGRSIAYKLNSTVDGTKGRVLGYTLANGATTEQDLSYAYDPNTDRFATLAVGNSGVAAAAHTFRYAYLTNSFLISALSVDGSPFTIGRTFETQRDVLTSVAGQWSTATRTRYDYTVNTLGQRTSMKQSGDAYADYGNASFQLFSYNSRSELTGAAGYLGTDTTQTTQPLPGRNVALAYDNIGNRVATNRTGNSADADNYTSNALNQIVTKENHAVQVSGTTDASANVAIEGRSSAASRQGRYWNDEVPVANGSGPWRGPILAYIGKSGAGPSGTDLLRIDSRIAQIASASQSFSYDLDGNLTADGLWDYTWDAENRLIAMQTSLGAATVGFPNQRLEFKYDYQGRRIEKLVRGGWNGSTFTTITTQRRYVYDGWNLIAEYLVLGASNLSLVRSYSWGLDIARTLSDAGGVGALLQIADHVSGKAYFTCYDGNGNIGALLNADSGAIAATYEYSPYGELLRSDAADSVLADQPFKFSTKYTDAETGLLYYGRRYYDPRNGRFLGRDSIEEKGGLHLYAFCLNNPINGWDVLGNGYRRDGTTVEIYTNADNGEVSLGFKTFATEAEAEAWGQENQYNSNWDGGFDDNSSGLLSHDTTAYVNGVAVGSVSLESIGDSSLEQRAAAQQLASITAAANAASPFSLLNSISGSSISVGNGVWLGSGPTPSALTTGNFPAWTNGTGMGGDWLSMSMYSQQIQAGVQHAHNVSVAYGGFSFFGAVNDFIGINNIGSAIAGVNLDGTTLSTGERWFSGVSGTVQLAGTIGTIGMWRAAVPTGSALLTKAQRLDIVFQRIANAGPATTADGAMQLVNSTLTKVEDSFSGVSAVANPGRVATPRMYPPQADSIVTGSDGSIVATSLKHITTYGSDGSITIVERGTGAVVLKKGGG